jgi:rhodanese-related sulfurtransferase
MQFSRRTGCFTNNLIALGIVVLISVLSTAAMAESEYPGRKLYPEVKYITLEQLHARRNEVVVVDVRSAYEYKTLRIDAAKNISVADEDFAAQMAALRKQDSRQIVVYCNGKTCMKSYKAARKCQLEDIKDVVAFDAGILDWAKKYPNETLLLGVKLSDPKKLISKARFKMHTLSPDDFGERLANSDDIVLDVRDRFQREGLSLFVGREFRVYIDDRKRLDRFLNKAKNENKGLLIYDATGHQVRWLQYYLEHKGLTKYFFMDGGIHSYYDEIEGKK